MKRTIRLAASIAGLAGTIVLAGPPTTIINFDTYPDGSAVQPTDAFTTQYSTVGVEFDGPGPSGNSCSISPPNHAYAKRIVASFVDPCTGVASVTSYAGTAQDSCWVPGEGIDMFAYDRDGNQIGHEFNAGGGHFTAFSFPQPVIARLDMYCILQGIDNLAFIAPVPVLRGDLNCDGAVTSSDVGPFVLALIDPSGYAGAFPSCDIRHADMNCDRRVDGLDIQGYIDAIFPP